MRVFSSISGKTRDGRIEETVAIASEAAKLIGRHGGDVRFFVVGAGDEAGTTLFNVEYESPEAMGRAIDKLAGDEDLAKFASRVNGPKSPTVMTAETIGMEVPTGRTPKAGRGSILEVHTATPNPGRMEQVVADAAEICEFVEANGAVNARLVQLTYAGPATGIVAFSWELENWAAHARMSAAWFSPAGLALQAKLMTEDPASVTGAGSLYSEIPL